jgi:hypothetical protein
MIRVDFDGDVNGANNQTNAQCDGALNNPNLDHTQTMYFSAVETGDDSGNGYYYLGYYWYHARDDGFCVSIINECDPGHEHDMEGVMMVIKKLAYDPYGVFVAALTMAHGALVPWRAQGNPQAGLNPGTVDINYGFVQSWPDFRFAGPLMRPVFITATGDHGTYAPQPADNCSGPDNGYGIFVNVPSPSSFGACVHSDRLGIFYQPMLEAALAPSSGLPQADQPNLGVNSGWLTYQLIEVAQSPMWTYSNTSPLLFAGPHLVFNGGYAGYADFYSTTDVNQSNPPWQWNGSYTCPFQECWYRFSEDGTFQSEDQISFPISSSGSFLVTPYSEVGLRFTGLPQLDAPVRYNPYTTIQPDYFANNQLSVSIDGPSMIPAGLSYTWTAGVSGGTPPYTYQWSGPLPGTSSSISGSLQSSDVLYLDVYDSAGGHVAVSYPVTVCQDGQISC